jgi:hypothetical protein
VDCPEVKVQLLARGLVFSIRASLLMSLAKEDITGMKPDEKSNQAIPGCDLCEREMNPTVRIYNHNTRLCSACFQHIQNLPGIVAKGVERFLIGNVV